MIFLKMKILLLNVTSSGFNVDNVTSAIKIFFTGIVSPPLTFRMLAAVTPAEHSLKLIDEKYQKINFNEECDIVGISLMTPDAVRAYEIADKFREKGIPVILGGWHPSALPHEAKQHADSVVIGDAEESWPQLLKDFEKDKLKSFYENPVDIKNLPVADRKRLSHKGGGFVEEIQASRGCQMGCKYCSITNSKYRKKFQFRPVEHVVNEISSIPQKYICFLDSSLTTNPKYLKELFKELKKFNKKFFCNGNAAILYRDDELLKLASDAGCIEWTIGFESASQESLNSIGKTTNKVKEFSPTVKKIHDYGMAVKGNIMFGFDGDNIDIFNKTIDAVYDWNIDSIDPNILTPFPGTPLFDYLKKENRIITTDWSKYNLKNVVFQPKNMTPQELLDGVARFKKTVYSTKNNIKRSFKCLRFGWSSFFTTGMQNYFMKGVT